LGDLSGDAVLDAVTAQGESLPQLNRVYQGVAPVPSDRRPPVLRYGPVLTSRPEAPIVVIFGLSDNTTTDGGPRLGPDGAFVEWQVEGEAPARVAATFLGGDLFRAVLPPEADGQGLMVRVAAVDQAGNEFVSSLTAPEVVSADHVDATPSAGTPTG
jgi:hypothetical protein